MAEKVNYPSDAQSTGRVRRRFNGMARRARRDPKFQAAVAKALAETTVRSDLPAGFPADPPEVEQEKHKPRRDSQGESRARKYETPLLIGIVVGAMTIVTTCSVAFGPHSASYTPDIPAGVSHDPTGGVSVPVNPGSTPRPSLYPTPSPLPPMPPRMPVQYMY